MAQILDIGLSLAFSFVGNLLKPRQVDKSPDSLPNPQFGTKLYRGWGTFMCPGMLVYALPPNLNNRVQLDKYNWSNPEEASSYVNFLISNPLNPTLRAVRVNGKVAASDLQSLPISADFKGFKVTDVATGLSRVNDFNFRFANGTQTTGDPVLIKGGSPLVYKGQCLLTVDSSLRAIYGGRGSSVSVVMTNDSSGLTSSTSNYWGFGDAPVTVTLNLTTVVVSGIFGSQSLSNSVVSKQAPRGFQFSQDIASFPSLTSIQPNGAKRLNVVFGTGSEFVISDAAVNPTMTVGNGGLGLSPAGTPGVHGRVAYVPGTPDVVNTNIVIVASVGSVTRSIVLGSSSLSPFWASAGVIKNAAGVTVGTCGINERVVGWDNKIFTMSAPKNNTTPIPSGTTYGQTTLIRIFTDLCNSADPPILFSFKPGFDETLLGYITNRSDITTDLSNLMSIFRKLVYQKRNSELVFDAYPLAAPTVKILPELHVSPPEITMTSKDQVTDAVNFSFRSVEAEFDSRTIRVGGDSDRVSDFTLEITATTKDASLYAQRLRNYQLSQTITGTLHLHPIANSIEGGDTYVLGKLTDSGTDLPIIILRVETGADGTVKADFINWVPDIFLDPNLTTSSLPATPVSQRIIKRALIDTEPRSNRIGSTYYTEDNAPALLDGTAISPSVGNLSGSVSQISSTTARVIIVGQTPVINTEYYIFNESTGEGSWVRTSAVALVFQDVYDLTFQSGLYASNTFFTYPVSPESLVIVGLSEQNTSDDNYLINTFQQSGSLSTWPFNTKKRLREPPVVGITGTANVVTFNRQSYLIQDDNDLGNEIAENFVYFQVENTTTNVIVNTSGSGFVFNIGINIAPGDIITIKQTDTAGVVLSYSAVAKYTIV